MCNCFLQWSRGCMIIYFGWKAILHELYPVPHLSVAHTSVFLTFSPLVLFRSNLPGGGGVGSCQQTHAVQLFSESIIEVRLRLLSYSETCLLILKRRRWRAMNPFNYLFLGEHGSGNANGTFSKYLLQETAWTKVWILILRGSSHACQNIDSKDTLPQYLQGCPPVPGLELYCT